MFKTNKNEDQKNVTQYAGKLRERLDDSYRLAQQNMKESQQRRKHLYDRKVRGVVLNKGDRTLVKIVAYDGTHKIADKWESFRYIVLSQQNPDIPVYRIQREDGVGKILLFLLLPINFIPEERVQIAPKPVPRRRITKTVQQDPTPTRPADSDSDSDYGYIGVPQNATHDVLGAVTEDIQGVESVPGSDAGDDHVSAMESRDKGGNENAHPSVDDADHATPDLDSEEQPADQDDIQDLDTEEGPDDDEDDDNTIPQTEATTPVPETRSSSRARKPPDWITSGEVLVLQHTAETDWKVRAYYFMQTTKYFSGQ